MKTRYAVFFILILFKTQLVSFKIEKTFKKNLKISIIIPCHSKHAIHLYPLLKHYAQQTIIPHEVVISLSESKKVKKSLLDKIEYEKWPFICKLLVSEEKLFAGQNRNKASEYSSGDILIYQDADDIPHPQRVEIIKYFFENYEIDHLMHLCEKKEEIKFKHYRPEEIMYFHLHNYKEILSKKFNTQNTVVTNGNPALKRSVFNNFKWSSTAIPAEDTHFNTIIYRHLQNRILLPIPLLIYRMRFSSWKN